MAMITSIGGPVPKTQPPSMSATEPPVVARTLPGTGSAVSPSDQPQAAQQAPSKPASADPQFLTARTTSATEAAEAARAAYIRASIAAGISPLPMP
jgi:hypothetical protein